MAGVPDCCSKVDAMIVMEKKFLILEWLNLLMSVVKVRVNFETVLGRYRLSQRERERERKKENTGCEVTVL